MPCRCAVPVSTLPCNPCHMKNATSAQKVKEKKKAKYDDSLQETRKNKKELEFEQKLYKEKEEMLEKEKQLKINRLAQEVRVLLPGPLNARDSVCLFPATVPGPQLAAVLPKWSPRAE